MSDLAKKADVPSQKPLEVAYGAIDRPLRIGEVEIPCYVLEGNMRVISQRGLQSSVGLSTSGASRAGASRFSPILKLIKARGIDVSDIEDRLAQPILFYQPTRQRQVAKGYEAALAVDFCHAIIDADEKSALPPQYAHLVVHCKVLSRAFAKVGIVALIDEATGYQHVRAEDALSEILRQYISDELRRWVKTFPDEFYKQLFRLRGLTYSQFTSKRPQYIGKLTNDIVYERLAPGVLDELRRKNPRLSSGNRQSKHFQWLTEDIGHPNLQQHLFAVTALMRAAPSWDAFYRSLQRALPKWSETLQMELISVPDDLEGLS